MFRLSINKLSTVLLQRILLKLMILFPQTSKLNEVDGVEEALTKRLDKLVASNTELEQTVETLRR